MRLSKYIAPVFLFLLYSFAINGQNNVIDSLKGVLQTQKEDTAKVNTMNQLSLALINNGYNNEALEEINKAIQLSRKINFGKGEGVAYDNKSSVFFNKGDYPAALNNLEIAIKIFHEADLKLNEAGTIIFAGNVCRQQYNIETAYRYYADALKIYEEIKDKKGIARAYADIGDLQRWQDNFAEALKSFLAALKIEEEIGNKAGISYVSTNIAYTYWDIGNYSEALKYHQAAFNIDTESKDERAAAISNKNMCDCYLKLSNYTEALSRCTTALKDLIKSGDQAWIASAYTSLGTIYEAMGVADLQSGNKEQTTKNFDQALNYYLLGLKLNEKTKFNIDESHYNLGNIYTRLNRLREARNSFEKSLEIAKQVNFKREIKSIYLGLSKIDSLEGNYKLAYEHYQKYNLYRDSLGDENNSKTAVELKLLYDFEKKETAAKLTQLEAENVQERKRIGQWRVIASLGLLILAFLLIMFFQWRNSKHRKRANLLLQQQKEKVETTLLELRSTQSQLIQSEKMASLGELTAGIAHEIQNPLNFVNNFSEVNDELLKELATEADKGNLDEVKAIAKDITFNSEKINHHGKRADAIVKGMLQHSRSNSGQKEPTDINALADEYLRLAYHGLRAKDKSFNATTKTDFDNKIGKINIMPQDMGRVILNLINNAFYAVDEKKKQTDEGYEPTVSVSTKKANGRVEIKVADNGNGIPQKVLDKIFQPFFTTKPTGQGTGLGLSLSYDIVKAHGGELKVETKEGEGTEFIIILPA